MLFQHDIDDAEEVGEVLLHLLLGLLDLASWCLRHPRDLLASQLGGEGQQPGQQGWEKGE